MASFHYFNQCVNSISVVLLLCYSHSEVFVNESVDCVIILFQRLFFLKCVLDTMVKGYEVDPSLLFDEQDDSNEGNGVEEVDSDSTNGEEDGPGVVPVSVSAGGTNNKTLYELISESEVEVCS